MLLSVVPACGTALTQPPPSRSRSTTRRTVGTQSAFAAERGTDGELHTRQCQLVQVDRQPVLPVALEVQFHCTAQ